MWYSIPYFAQILDKKTAQLVDTVRINYFNSLTQNIVKYVCILVHVHFYIRCMYPGIHIQHTTRTTHALMYIVHTRIHICLHSHNAMKPQDLSAVLHRSILMDDSNGVSFETGQGVHLISTQSSQPIHKWAPVCLQDSTSRQNNTKLSCTHEKAIDKVWCPSLV